MTDQEILKLVDRIIASIDGCPLEPRTRATLEALPDNHRNLLIALDAAANTTLAVFRDKLKEALRELRPST